LQDSELEISVLTTAYLLIQEKPIAKFAIM